MTPEVSSAVNNKRQVYDRVRQLLSAPAAELLAVARGVYTDDAVCEVAEPINCLRGAPAIVSRWWEPLRLALPDLERRDDVIVAGHQNDTTIFATVGSYQGTFRLPLLGIPPTQGVVQLRFGEVAFVRDGRIYRSWLLVDFLDLMRQARCWPLVPSLGSEGSWPGPPVHAGPRLDIIDPSRGARSLAIVKAMHRELHAFDGKTIESMRHEQYWTTNFMWYGPAGIGTTRGLEGFRAHHQMAFLSAFPDRKGTDSIVNLGDGDYVATGGWPGMLQSHTGGNWLGLAPTNRRVTVRVMDFYRLEGDLIAENWVPIDMIDILQQLGVDVFARMRHLQGLHATTL